LVTQSDRRPISEGNAVIVGPDFASGWQDALYRKCRVLAWMWRRPATSLLAAQPTSYFYQVAVPVTALARLRVISEMCREQIRRVDPVMPIALHGLQCVLESILIQSAGAELRRDPRGQRVDLSTRWMQSHLESRRPAARIADYLGISPSSLQRLFKEQLGCSLDSHFKKLKMATAMKRLRDGCPVKEVAYGLGYRHSCDFTRAYTRFFGHAPGTEDRVPVAPVVPAVVPASEAMVPCE
jgi:AraC-like DNA-binding protein